MNALKHNNVVIRGRGSKAMMFARLDVDLGKSWLESNQPSGSVGQYYTALTTTDPFRACYEPIIAPAA